MLQAPPNFVAMQRLIATAFSLLLFCSSFAAAVGQVEICISEDHVALAPPAGHQFEAPPCCEHAHSCTDIIVESVDHNAPMACDSPGSSAAPVVSFHRSQRCAPLPLVLRPDHPPPIGLIITQSTVRRL